MYGAKLAHELGANTPVGFLWEFEEEIGSPSFESTIGRHRESLATGSVVVSDAIPLVFPVRSLTGLFAWVTSVETLSRFRRDVAAYGVKIAELPQPPALDPETAGRLRIVAGKFACRGCRRPCGAYRGRSGFGRSARNRREI